MCRHSITELDGSPEVAHPGSCETSGLIKFINSKNVPIFSQQLLLCSKYFNQPMLKTIRVPVDCSLH